MSHTCPECGHTCHCGGDIDDVNWGELDSCKCSVTPPTEGCGNDLDLDRDDEETPWGNENYEKDERDVD